MTAGIIGLYLRARLAILWYSTGTLGTLVFRYNNVTKEGLCTQCSGMSLLWLGPWTSSLQAESVPWKG